MPGASVRGLAARQWSVARDRDSEPTIGHSPHIPAAGNAPAGSRVGSVEASAGERDGGVGGDPGYTDGAHGVASAHTAAHSVDTALERRPPRLRGQPAPGRYRVPGDTAGTVDRQCDTGVRSGHDTLAGV